MVRHLVLVLAAARFMYTRHVLLRSIRWWGFIDPSSVPHRLMIVPHNCLIVVTSSSAPSSHHCLIVVSSLSHHHSLSSSPSHLAPSSSHYHHLLLISHHTASQMDEPIVAMRFGGYGRASLALALAGRSGALSIKMLQRKAVLELSSESNKPPVEESTHRKEVSLKVLKTSRLDLEFADNEREQAGASSTSHPRLPAQCTRAVLYSQSTSRLLAPPQFPSSGGASARVSVRPSGGYSQCFTFEWKRRSASDHSWFKPVGCRI